MDIFDLIIAGFLVSVALMALRPIAWLIWGDYQDAKKYASKKLNNRKNRRI